MHPVGNSVKYCPNALNIKNNKNSITFGKKTIKISSAIYKTFCEEFISENNVIQCKIKSFI